MSSAALESCSLSVDMQAYYEFRQPPPNCLVCKSHQFQLMPAFPVCYGCETRIEGALEVALASPFEALLRQDTVTQLKCFTSEYHANTAYHALYSGQGHMYTNLSLTK